MLGEKWQYLKVRNDKKNINFTNTNNKINPNKVIQKMKLYKKLEEVLKKEQNHVTDEGELKKWVIISKAQNNDPRLISALLVNGELKDKFFIPVEGALVFNQSLFVQFLEQKNYLNDSYTQYSNKVGLNIDGKFLNQRNEISLVWPYKDCVLEGGQSKEEDAREEVFFNQVLAQDEINQLLEPKVLTAGKRYSSNSLKDFDSFKRNSSGVISDNLVVKGNNLIALHSLKKEFLGKIKLIYIDPPYNTGGDKNIFSYNNTFNHSSWLTFMKNRLEIAKEFLTADGYITIAIDHCELFYLGALADEVFGMENRIAVITVVHNPKGRNQAKFFSENSEFLLVYAKDVQKATFNQVAIDEDVLATFNLEDDSGKYRFENYIRARTAWSRTNRPKNWYPIYVSKDLKKITSEYHADYHELLPRTAQGDFSWKNIKETFDELNKDGYFKAEKSGEDVVLLHKYYEQQVLKNVWTDKKYQSEFNGTNLLKRLIGPNSFSYPKSLFAVIDVIKIMTKPGDIVMDFFGGSGTTAHAILEVNGNSDAKRTFVLVEQLGEHIDITLQRLEKVITNSTDSFVYMELKKYNQVFVEKIIEAKDTTQLMKVWESMKEKSFLNYNIDLKKQEEHIEDFKALSIDEQKAHLVEILDKNQLYINLSSIGDTDFEVSAGEKLITNDFYRLEKN